MYNYLVHPMPTTNPESTNPTFFTHFEMTKNWFQKIPKKYADFMY